MDPWWHVTSTVHAMAQQCPLHRADKQHQLWICLCSEPLILFNVSSHKTNQNTVLTPIKWTCTNYKGEQILLATLTVATATSPCPPCRMQGTKHWWCFIQYILFIIYWPFFSPKHHSLKYQSNRFRYTTKKVQRDI